MTNNQAERTEEQLRAERATEQAHRMIDAEISKEKVNLFGRSRTSQSMHTYIAKPWLMIFDIFLVVFCFGLLGLPFSRKTMTNLAFMLFVDLILVGLRFWYGYKIRKNMYR